MLIMFFLDVLAFFLLLRESKLPKYSATAAVRTYVTGGVKKSRKNKKLPTLEPIFSGAKKFGGIWIISTGGMGYGPFGAPVEDGAPCQKSLVYIGGDCVKKTFLTKKKYNF